MKESFKTQAKPRFDGLNAMVHTVILQDPTGWVQVVLDKAGLLDVALVRQRLKRSELHPIDAKDAVKHGQGWAHLPTLAPPTSTITLIDSHLTTELLNSCDHAEITQPPSSDQLSDWIIAYEQNNLSPVIIAQLSLKSSALVCLPNTQPPRQHSQPSAKLDAQVSNSEHGFPTQGTGSASIPANPPAAQDTPSAIVSLTHRRLLDRVANLQEIPPLPKTAEKIIKLRVNPSADITDLMHIVEKDPCLAAQVMSWALSPYYAPLDGVRSLHDAILRVLGFDMVLNLSLGICLNHNALNDRTSTFNKTGHTIGQRSTLCSELIEMIVSQLPRAQRPMCGLASLSGLMSEFGELLLMTHFPPHHQQLSLLQRANQHLSDGYLEKHCLGVTRDELAAALLEHWHLPEEVITALKQQGNAEDYQEKHAIYVHLLAIARGLIAERSQTGPQESDGALQTGTSALNWRALAKQYRLNEHVLLDQARKL